MTQINIPVKGNKASPEEVKAHIEFMLKELGEDGLCHLVQAYKESANIKALVKGEIQARKLSASTKKAGRKFMNALRGK